MKVQNLVTFDYNSFEVRVIDVDGQPHFVLNDLCAVLGIGNPRMVADRLNDDYVSKTDIADARGQLRKTTVVTEPGMYEVILRSNAENARPFQKWVYEQVLPQIRRTGSYGAPVQLTEDQIVHQALQITARKVEQLEAQVKVLEPKAEAFDGYLSASGDYSINEAAKLLARRGVQGIGQNRLRDHLLNWGWLYRGAKQRLRASQAQVDNGRLAERTSYYYDQVTGEKKAGSSPQPRVTPKGIDAIEKRLALAVAS